MAAPIFVGDEVSAAGYRLAGALVRVPPPGEEAATLNAVRKGASLVLITAECAERIPQETMRRALAAQSPLVLIVPDIRGRVAPPDLARLLRAQLGMET